MKDMSKNLADILKGLELERNIPTIRRIPYAYDMATALKVVEAIGRVKSQRFTIDENNRFVYENLIKWVNGDPTMKCNDPENWRNVVPADLSKGIYIGGRTGTGKSWAMEVMSLYTRADNVCFRVGANALKLLQWPCVRTTALVAGYSLTGQLHDYATKPIVCFQDLGSEPNDALYMGNRQNVMKHILEERGDNKCCITLITSNYPIIGPDMERLYGQRVTSRLREMCNFLILGGEDRRK